MLAHTSGHTRTPGWRPLFWGFPRPIWRRKQTQSLKCRVFWYSETGRWTDNPTDFECYTPSSEPFRIYYICTGLGWTPMRGRRRTKLQLLILGTMECWDYWSAMARKRSVEFQLKALCLRLFEGTGLSTSDIRVGIWTPRDITGTKKDCHSPDRSFDSDCIEHSIPVISASNCSAFQ
jgi:hypothetical protein